jgi:putative hydrolase of the HAD superfamily
MNFIFDIGNVLIDYKPQRFLEGLYDDPALRERLLRLIFGGEEWVELDRGTITLEQACESICRRAPGLAGEIRAAMGRLTEMFTPIPQTASLLPAVREAGHGLYYLSNYHTAFSRYILGRYNFFRLFDGGVFSCDVHLLKPDPAIYRRLLDAYSLTPASCVFFDDTAANVRTALSLGFEGVVFTGAQDVADQLAAYSAV